MTAPHLDGAPVVLVVDDDPVVRKVMEYALLDAGYVVRTASGAMPALHLLGALNTPPAAVVTDLGMDIIGGASLARLARRCGQRLTDFPTSSHLTSSGRS